MFVKKLQGILDLLEIPNISKFHMCSIEGCFPFKASDTLWFDKHTNTFRSSFLDAGPGCCFFYMNTCIPL